MDALISFLPQLAPQHWLALAFVLLIAELVTGTTYILWPAVAAGITGLASFMPGMSWQGQLALFAVLVLVLTWVGRDLRAKLYRTKPAVMLNERAADLVGQCGAAAGAFVNGLGSVRINDSIWRAKSADAIEAGARVEVLSVEGVTLNVKPAA